MFDVRISIEIKKIIDFKSTFPKSDRSTLLDHLIIELRAKQWCLIETRSHQRHALHRVSRNKTKELDDVYNNDLKLKQEGTNERSGERLRFPEASGRSWNAEADAAAAAARAEIESRVAAQIVPTSPVLLVLEARS